MSNKNSVFRRRSIKRRMQWLRNQRMRHLVKNPNTGKLEIHQGPKSDIEKIGEIISSNVSLDKIVQKKEKLQPTYVEETVEPESTTFTKIHSENSPLETGCPTTNSSEISSSNIKIEDIEIKEEKLESPLNDSILNTESYDFRFDQYDNSVLVKNDLLEIKPSDNEYREDTMEVSSNGLEENIIHVENITNIRNFRDPLDTNCSETYMEEGPENQQRLNIKATKKTLTFLSEFFKFKGIHERLTMRDVEEFCEERECEVIIIDKRDARDKDNFRHLFAKRMPMSVLRKIPIPPAPVLSGTKLNNDIELTWNMPSNLNQYDEIISYQVYGYSVVSGRSSIELKKREKLEKVCEVKPRNLPMKYTLKNIDSENKHYFFVRAVDIHNRSGYFSNEVIIALLRTPIRTSQKNRIQKAVAHHEARSILYTIHIILEDKQSEFTLLCCKQPLHQTILLDLQLRAIDNM